MTRPLAAALAIRYRSARPARVVLAALALCLAPGADATAGAGDAPAPPADFKLELALYSLERKPVSTGQMVVHKGVAYQFLTEIREEVQILDERLGRVVLVDLQRKIQTEISRAQLDAHLASLRRSLESVIQRREKSESRADRVAAGMTRDLLDPRYAETLDAAKHALHLTNESLTVDAVGAPDDDPARRALVAGLLASIVKLGAFRDPTSYPPFCRLAVLEALATRHELRPVEITMILRLAGPPRRLRWTYRLVPTLTDREREAILRVATLRETARFVPYARYDGDEEP